MSKGEVKPWVHRKVYWGSNCLDYGGRGRESKMAEKQDFIQQSTGWGFEVTWNVPIDPELDALVQGSRTFVGRWRKVPRQWKPGLWELLPGNKKSTCLPARGLCVGCCLQHCPPPPPGAALDIYPLGNYKLILISLRKTNKNWSCGQSQNHLGHSINVDRTWMPT